jgi:hypothetical protein
MKSAFFVFGGLLLFSVAASALDVRFLAWDDATAARELAVFSGGGAKVISHLHPIQRSDKVITSLVDGSILLRARDRKTAEGTPVDFAVEIGAGISHPLVLLVPDPKVASGIRGFAIEDGNGPSPWGSFRLFNSTGRELVCSIGKERQMLPASGKPVDVKPFGTERLPVRFTLPAEPLKPLYSSIWPVDENVRMLVILIPGTAAATGPIEVKIIRDDRRAEAGEPNSPR